jgi:hypothetical protein
MFSSCDPVCKESGQHTPVGPGGGRRHSQHAPPGGPGTGTGAVTQSEPRSGKTGLNAFALSVIPD